MAEAVQARLRQLEASIAQPAEWEVIGRISAEYEQRIAHFSAHVDGGLDPDLDETQHTIKARLRREAYSAERAALHDLRRSGAIGDEAYRQVEWQVDLAESRLSEA
jgi:hypothetical protein